VGSISDAELLRWIINAVLAILGGCGVVAWWGVRVIVNNIAGLRSSFASEIRHQDVRLTRVETHLDLPPLPRHDRVA